MRGGCASKGQYYAWPVTIKKGGKDEQNMTDNIKEDKRRLLNKGYLLGYIMIAIVSLFMLIIRYLKTGQMDVGMVGITFCLIGTPHVVRGVVYGKTGYWILGSGLVLMGLYYIFRYMH